MLQRHVSAVSFVLTAAVTALALVLTALVTPAHAQGPQGAGQAGQSGPGNGVGFHGNMPGRGGWGLLLMDQDMSRDRLMLQLRDQDCEPQGIGWFAGGRWSMFVPGAPDFVNQDFPARLRTGDIFAARCANGGTPVSARLTDANNGAAITVGTGDRVRVALTANPSTGYTWTANPAPSASVLVQQGDPFFVPSSDLLGADGHQVFDFVAQGPGTVTLSMQYARPFESVPPTQTWSVSITVTP